jgi:hypothetical protein
LHRCHQAARVVSARERPRARHDRGGVAGAHPAARAACWVSVSRCCIATQIRSRSSSSLRTAKLRESLIAGRITPRSASQSYALVAAERADSRAVAVREEQTRCVDLATIWRCATCARTRADTASLPARKVPYRGVARIDNQEATPSHLHDACGGVSDRHGGAEVSGADDGPDRALAFVPASISPPHLPDELAAIRLRHRGDQLDRKFSIAERSPGPCHRRHLASLAAAAA